MFVCVGPLVVLCYWASRRMNLFDTRLLVSQTASSALSKVAYIGSVLCLAGKIHSDTSPSPNFYTMIKSTKCGRL